MKLPVFNEKQIDKQVKKISNFLKVIYPFLNEDNWQDGCIELRPLKRDKNARFIKSFNAWRLMQKDLNSLKEFLQMINGQGFCVYYSVFAFKYDLEVKNSNGKKRRAGMINKENALSTQVLVMDFDDISKADFELEKQKLLDLGIETIDIYSGHGYQSIILLKKKVYDKQILRKFTTLLIQKGFKVDEAIVDAARVMRLPYTFNCKSLDKNNKYYNENENCVIPVGVACFTEKRYDVVDVFSKINTLKDIIPSNDNQQIMPLIESTFGVETSQKLETREEILKVQRKVEFADIEIGKKLYPMIPFERLPNAIQKMLLGAMQGIRNNTAYFLLNFFAKTLGYTKVQLKEIMVIWGSQCTPALGADFIKQEVERLYEYKKYPYSSKAMPKLVKEYGYIDIGIYKKESNVIIPNALFENYAELPDAAIKIYFTLKLAHTLQKVENYTLEEIERISELSRSTVIKNIPALVKYKLLSKKNGNNRIGEKDIYYPTPFFEKSAGFTLLPLDLANMLKEMATNSELKVYLLMRKMVGPLGGTCIASQKHLTKELGKRDQSALSKLTSRMHEKGFIKKVTEKYQNVLHTSYMLTNEIYLNSTNHEINAEQSLITAS